MSGSLLPAPDVQLSDLTVLSDALSSHRPFAGTQNDDSNFHPCLFLKAAVAFWKSLVALLLLLLAWVLYCPDSPFRKLFRLHKTMSWLTGGISFLSLKGLASTKEEN